MCGDIVRSSSHVLFFIVAIAIVCHCISFTVVASEPVGAQYGFSDLGSVDPLAFDPYAFDPLSFVLAADGDIILSSDGGESDDKPSSSEPFSFDTFDWVGYERIFNPDFVPKYDTPKPFTAFQSTGKDTAVLDSEKLPLDSGVPSLEPPNVTIDSGFVLSNNVDDAILDIRNYIFFSIYGIFPLMCALLILYLLFRWIYRLIIYCV